MSKRKRAHPAHYLEFATRITQTLINKGSGDGTAETAAKIFKTVHEAIKPPDPKPQPEVNNQQPPAEQVEASTTDTDSNVDEDLTEEQIDNILAGMVKGAGYKVNLRKFEIKGEIDGVHIEVTFNFLAAKVPGYEKLSRQLLKLKSSSQ